MNYNTTKVIEEFRKEFRFKANQHWDDGGLMEKEGFLAVSSTERYIEKLLKSALQSAFKEGEKAREKEIVDLATLAFGKNHQNYKEFIKSLPLTKEASLNPTKEGSK